jgi:hypothetical protein
LLVINKVQFICFAIHKHLVKYFLHRLLLTHWDLEFKCCTCISNNCLCVGGGDVCAGILNTCTNNCKGYLKLWNFASVDVGFLGNECSKFVTECTRQFVGRCFSYKEPDGCNIDVDGPT